MKRILFIEHDPSVGNIYRCKFTLEGFEVELAEDGVQGLAALQTFKPDLVILDLTLPKISGAEIIRQIRSRPTTRNLPVIVFTNAYNPRMIEEAWKAGANQCLARMDSPPQKVLKVVHSTLRAVEERSAPQPRPVQPATAEGVSLHAALHRTFPQDAATLLTQLRQLWKSFVKVDESNARFPILFELYRKVHSLTGNASVAEERTIARISAALELLLRKVHDKPERLSASTPQTIAQCLDFLGELVDQIQPDHDHDVPASTILVIDDELVSRQAAVYALGQARLKCIAIDDPIVAYHLLGENPVDLIVADIEMPGMTGLKLCERVRKLPAHENTPLLFLTRLTDFQTHARATLSGATDFISKPFLPNELAVKALIHLTRGQNQARQQARTKVVSARAA